MAKDSKLVTVLIWLTGLLVSLAVGFGMIDGTLVVPFIAPIVMTIAGWIVVLGAIVSAIMAVVN